MENHYINLENQRKITITEVKDIDAFDEDVILVNLQQGGIIIKGEQLNIERLDLEEGKLVAIGKIISVSYTNKSNKNQNGNRLVAKILSRRKKV
ncbi:MAG: YabP/YqfC family sporulation protein [Anaerovoracaceae bacterium]